MENDSKIPILPKVRVKGRRSVLNHPREKVSVFIRYSFLKVADINTQKEQFCADVFIQAKWREPALDNKKAVDPDTMNWDEYWKPKLVIENATEIMKEKKWYLIEFDATGKATILQRRRLRANFIENLELEEFPFDVQALSVTVTSHRSDTEVELLEDTDQASTIQMDSFKDASEWHLYKHVDISKKVTTKEYTNSKYKYSVILGSCFAVRKYGFFLWNVLLIMLFICSLGLCTFSVSVVLPQNRLQLSFTLVLTIVAFKYVINQSLPKISYLTYLDIYVLVSLTMLFLICCWHSVLSQLQEFGFSESTQYWADKYGLYSFAVLYVIFHIIYITGITVKNVRRRVDLRNAEKKHKARVLAESLEAADRVDPVGDGPQSYRIRASFPQMTRGRSIRPLDLDNGNSPTRSAAVIISNPARMM
ncbi:cys-loop ligand-gated ion channel-like [Lineus longissimus]|uniref:cys-loop ligand-gated ion channel-like n=1 Tax=Lineus longissimus TaxID=88925 RepID=UPI00315C8B0D